MTTFSPTDTPPYKWKTVRVFISSTFRDFHAERDYLVKYVFPELRQWCEQYRLHLVDIDLRWGVTEKEAESGKVIELCLEQIDGCRPFFICMLGSRYGWIPGERERGKVNEQTLRSFPDLRVRWKDVSVTHLEIMHAALSPLHRGEPVPHSFFYFRDEKSLPGENELHLLTEKEREEYLKAFREEDPVNTGKLASLKSEIRDFYKQDAGKRIVSYVPTFDASLSNPEDDRLKGRFTPDSLTPFGEMVKKHLLRSLELRFAARIRYLSEKREEKKLENERDFHETFIENRTALFIGRTELLQRLHEYVSGDSKKILAVYGESGSGKSSLLAKFYREYKSDTDGNERNPEVLFIPHFVGASPSSASLISMLRRFCEEMKSRFRYEEEIPFDPNSLILLFRDFLDRAEGRVILMIDGLNQLNESDRAQELGWLPYELPGNVKIIVSTLEGTAREFLKGKTNEQLDVVELNLEERREIIREMPSVFAKTLEEKHIDMLLEKSTTSNPLYLKVALEELRIFGSYEKLEEKVRRLPDTVMDMFIAVLERLEQEGDKDLVEQLFCLLECSRYGLTARELEVLLNDRRKEHLIILRQLREYFISREGMIDFFHRALSKAVRHKYDLQHQSVKWHGILAGFFAGQPSFRDGDIQKDPNVHKCLEQAWQEARGEMWDEAANTLCDLEFIQAKCSAGLTYDLIEDYHVTMSAMPGPSSNVHKRNQPDVEQYAKDLIRYARGEIGELEIPDSSPPWSEEKIRAEIERIRSRPGRTDRLRDFYNFLGNEAGTLHKHAGEIPHLATQQAWNYAREGPVGTAASRMNAGVRNRLLLRTEASRPFKSLFPQVLKSLKGHSDTVEAAAMTPDGKWGLSGSWDRTCILWDLEGGNAVKTLSGHSSKIISIAITPDGRWGLSGSWDKTCILWDLVNGLPVKTLEQHTGNVNAVALSPDGQRAVSGSEDHTCILWDLQQGVPDRILEGHTGPVTAVAITPDGKRALSGSEDTTCILWDLERGLPLKTLQAPEDSYEPWINSMAITPDGSKALIGSYHTGCILWDLDSGLPIRHLGGHTHYVNSLAITPDGKLGLSCSNDRTHILWDLIRGIPLKVFEGYIWIAGAASVTADGKKMFSCSEDDACLLWDLERGLPDKPAIETGSAKSMAIDLVNRRAFSGSHGSICMTVNLLDGQVVKTLEGHSRNVNSVALARDGKTGISGSDDKTCILWDLDAGRPVRTLKGHTGKVRTVAVTPDGSMGLSGSEDKTCILWDLVNGSPPVSLEGHAYDIYAVAVSPDGRRGLSASSDNTCVLWDLERGMKERTLSGHTKGVLAVAFTPDGKRAVSASWDTTCILWDLESGASLKILRGHTNFVMCLAITPDGKRAISGSWDDDHSCIVWDLKSGQVWKTLKGHNEYVMSLDISPDGKMAVTASKDGTCILWDLQKGEKAGQYYSPAEIYLIKFYPDGITGSSTDIFTLRTRKGFICPGAGIVTARKIWDFRLKQYHAPSADCPFCGFRFAPAPSVLETIAEITKKAGLNPEQSPCLALSDDLREEPGLISSCPQCGEELKFNPFLAAHKDTRERGETDDDEAGTGTDPEDPAILLEKGKALLDEHRDEEAMEVFREAILLRSDFAEAHTFLGVALRRADRPDEAISAYKSAIAADPDYELAHFLLGVAFGLKGWTNDAKRAYKNALRIKDYDQYAHFNLGLLYKKEGSRAEAAYHLKKALELGYEPARKQLDEL